MACAGSPPKPSGDLTSAPQGAEEFLDIDLAKAAGTARRRGWRSLVPVVCAVTGRRHTKVDVATLAMRHVRARGGRSPWSGAGEPPVVRWLLPGGRSAGRVEACGT